jgi:L-lactate dehydrogenase complex protein LldG
LSSEPEVSAVERDGGQQTGSRAATDRFRDAVGRASSSFHEFSGWPELVEHLGDVEVVAIAPSLARSQPHLVAALEGRGARVVVPDGEDPAAQVADVPVGVTWAEMAIAETGSLLISEYELGDRVVTMLCRRLVQVIGADAIEARLEAAATWMRNRAGQPGFVSLMTGPSRTADIERSLTIGVQGPDAVDVVVLRDTEVRVATGAGSTNEVSA